MTIKIGFVGTGGIANHHLRTLAQLDEAELVALLRRSRRKGARRSQRVRW